MSWWRFLPNILHFGAPGIRWRVPPGVSKLQIQAAIRRRNCAGR